MLDTVRLFSYFVQSKNEAILGEQCGRRAKLITENKNTANQPGQVAAGNNTDDAVTKFRQYIRDVDALIRSGMFDKARARLTMARELEPSNPYLTAFEERIRYLEKNPHPAKQTRPDAVPVTKPETPAVVRPSHPSPPVQPERKIRQEIEGEYKDKFTRELHNVEKSAVRTLEQFENSRKQSLLNLEKEFEQAVQSQIAAERKRIQGDAEATIEAEKKRLQFKYDALVAEHNSAIKQVREELRKNMEETFLRRLEQISKEYDDKLEILGANLPKTKEERIAIYREKMHDYYGDGQPSVENAKRLMQLKELFEITFDEHFSVESDVRLELYMANVQKGILSGKITLKNKKSLDEVKQRFCITKEQEASLASFIKSSLHRGTSKGRLLVVDDDEALVKLLTDALKENGYQVITAFNVESAFHELQNNSVDLILSDIKFPEGDLDGFKFFSTVQGHSHLRRIPFVFMSALHDGVIVRSGFQLGVDDYVTKPLDMDLLLAIIDGKLKRYRMLELI
jgi:CheY-like chemotaxis protein